MKLQKRLVLLLWLGCCELPGVGGKLGPDVHSGGIVTVEKRVNPQSGQCVGGIAGVG